MIPDVRDMSYGNRLEDLGLMSLRMRRFRADLIETIHIIRGFEDIEPVGLFHFAL